MIQQPKKSLLQFPGLWLPNSPLPGAMGFGRRCCCGTCEPEDCNCTATTNVSSCIQIEITISGITNDECSDCANLNGVYLLDNSNLVQCSGLVAEWQFNFAPTICDMGKVVFQIATIASTHTVWVRLRFPGDAAGYSFNVGIANGTICNELDISLSPVFGIEGCDVDSATCSVVISL